MTVPEPKGPLAPVRHRWDVSPREALALQRELAGRALLVDAHGPIETVGGVDVAMHGDLARAAIVVLRLPELYEVERAWAEQPVAFPYVPGLLSFREAPVVLAAYERLCQAPDALMLDGQGYAHPRRMGLATHLGLWLDLPTVGCAKTRLCGTYREPGPARGSQEPLWDGEECIGAVVRTRDNVRPVYVSVGHRFALAGAVALAPTCPSRRGARTWQPRARGNGRHRDLI